MRDFMHRLSAIALTLMMFAGAGMTTAQAASNTLTYAMYGDIKDWDPAVAFSLEVIMLANVYEPLIWYNPPGSEQRFSPALATSWQASDDGTTWTFNLREGVTFHDGTPFDAAAAKASLERTIEMEQGAYYIWDPVERIEAPDAETLVIHTSRPAPIDLIASSQYGAYMYSPAAAEKGTDWFNEGHAAGTGPYRVRQWAQGQQVVLEHFDDYWDGRDDDQFDRVFLRVVTENATQLQMLQSGEADFISLVPADAMTRLNERDDVTAELMPSWKNSQFLINVDKSPTDNLSFRRALVHAWDYATVTGEIYANSAVPARGPVPATMWGHDPSIDTPAFDLSEAERLIAESGVAPEDRRISMAYIGTSEEYQNAALLYQQTLQQIGIEVELKPGPWGTIWDQAKDPDTAPNLQSMTWWPTYATPSDWLIGLFRTEDPTLFNLSHYSSTEFDETVNEAVRLEGIDRDKAIAKYHEAQQILMEDAPAIFYADLQSRIARQTSIEGFEPNPAYNAVFFHELRRSE